ncbi:MAG: acyl-CoA dehydrogenase family protein [Polaromonas sp.]
MKFEFDERQSALFAQFAEFGRSVATTASEHDAEASLDHVNWQRIGSAGIWRLPVARELGGLGGSWADCVAAMEGLATTANDLGFMITMLGHVGALRLLLEEGSTQQQQRWLEPLMRGDIGVTAMTEDTGGSDLARMRTAAFKGSAGWHLSGCKRHITNAPVAKLGMIAGRIPALGEKRDITLFFVELGAQGVTIGQPENNLGIRTSPTADITFENSPISDENIVGSPGDGLRLLYRVISFERALYGAIASGLIEGMIQKAMDRVEARKAFSRPLADYQYVQGRIADMKTTSILCRLMSYAALDKVEKKTDDYSIHCSVAKLLAGEGLLAAAEHLVQLHGHLGFMNNNLSRQLRDAVGMRIAGGTSDIQRINIFNQVRRQHGEHNASRTPMATPELDAEPSLTNG